MYKYMEINMIFEVCNICNFYYGFVKKAAIMQLVANKLPKLYKEMLAVIALEVCKAMSRNCHSLTIIFEEKFLKIRRIALLILVYKERNL